jgi:hypothetical protein
MSSYTAKGLRAAARAVRRNKERIQAGQGRLAITMGADDPRNRRNAQGAQAAERRYHPDFFFVDQHGRLRPKA